MASFFNTRANIYLPSRVDAGATVTVILSDHVVLCSNVAARAVTLPAATTAVTSQEFMIKDTAGTAATANITIDVSGGANIDGSSTKVVNINYGSVTIISDGSKYFTVGSNAGGGGSASNDFSLNGTSNTTIANDTKGAFLITITPTTNSCPSIIVNISKSNPSTSNFTMSCLTGTVGTGSTEFKFFWDSSSGIEVINTTTSCDDTYRVIIVGQAS